jgi:hypothetical protein
MMWARVQSVLRQSAQVAAVAGVRGVPATAGVRGGWSAIFSRKATRLLAVCSLQHQQGQHTLATHRTFALTSIG